MKGFCELLCWVSTKALGNIKYLTINTRSNRVVIISSVITRIFLTLCNARRSHFNKDTRDLFMLCIMLVCQLYRVLFDYCWFDYFSVVRFSFVFCSTFVFIQFFCSIRFHCSLFTRKNMQFWSWFVFQVFRSCSSSMWSTHNCATSSSSKSINIIHQTAPSLSLFRSEWPIPIIDIAGYTEPIFSKL